jgi:predicted DNA-binding transcriptional regulator
MIIIFSLGFLSGILAIGVIGIVYARRQPRKVAESMMKFEMQTEEQNLERLKKKVREGMKNG